MVTVIRPSRARCVKEMIPRQESAGLTARHPARAGRTPASGLNGAPPGPRLRLAFKSWLVCPRKADTSERLIARRADLLSNYLSQRFIYPVLPARPGFLKVIKNVPVNSQRDKLLGIRDGRTLGREFRGLRGCRFKRRFSRLPLGGGYLCSVGMQFLFSSLASI